MSTLWNELIKGVLCQTAECDLLGSFTKGLGFIPAKTLIAATSATEIKSSQLPGKGNNTELG